MKHKLHNFNTMDFLFFLIAIFPLVFPLFCIFCSALATESVNEVRIPYTYWLDMVQDICPNNILGLESFNNWVVNNVLYFDTDFSYAIISCAEWYLFVYLFRMAFDFLMVIPNIVHNFVHKLGGTSSD